MKNIELESEAGRFAITTIAGKHNLWLNIQGSKTGILIDISQRVAIEIENYILKHGFENGQQHERPEID